MASGSISSKSINFSRISHQRSLSIFFQNPEEKQKAQGIFLDIQQACDRLSHERKRRQKLHTLTS